MFVSSETQTCVPDVVSQLVETSASEQGTSQFADDGWAETQRKIDEIGSQLIELRVAVEAIPGYIISGLRPHGDHDCTDLQDLDVHEQEHLQEPRFGSKGD